MSVAHTVETREVGEGLAGRKHIVGADGSGGVGQLDLDELGTGTGKVRSSGLDCLAHLGRDALGVRERGDDSDALAGDPVVQVRALITQDYKNAFQKVDAVLMPSAPFTAFKFGELSNPTQMYMADMFTVPLNIAGNCGVSVPVGLGRETGRPVGAQLIGPAFADDQLLRIAATLQGFYPELPVSKDFAKGEQR